MNIEEIKDGTILYIDASILVCCFGQASMQSVRLLERCKRNEVLGVISSLSLAEFVHASMLIELGRLTGKAKETVQYARRHPEKIRELREYARAAEKISESSNLTVVGITRNDILRSRWVRSSYGLLANDSIVVQIMLRLGISALAACDKDFARIKDIYVFSPTDVT